MSAIPLSQLSTSGRWQDDFLAILPVVQTHAKISFRQFRPDAKEEAVSEAIASAFVAYGSLASSGKLHAAYPSTLANYAVKAVRADRHVGSGQSSKDAMSRLAQQKHWFRRLRVFVPSNGRPTLLDCEDHRTPLPDAVAFRIDFSEWCDRFNDRKRKVLLSLAEGAAAWGGAAGCGLSPGCWCFLRG